MKQLLGEHEVQGRLYYFTRENCMSGFRCETFYDPMMLKFGPAEYDESFRDDVATGG